MVKWEYCQAGIKQERDQLLHRNTYVEAWTDKAEPIAESDTFIHIFNRLGQEGWEMCGNIETVFYFKRQIN